MKKIVCIGFLIFSVFLSENSLAADRAGRGEGMDKEVVVLINRARARGMNCDGKYFRSARPVQWNDTIGEATMNHCMDMVKRGLLCHSDYAGGKPGDVLSRLGYRWRAFGENVGEGYRTSGEMVKGWLESAQHCGNIMNPVFTEAGSSYAWRAGRIYWTLILATPR